MASAAEGRHGPIWLEPGDFGQEVPDQARAVGRVVHFGVELHGVATGGGVLDHGKGRAVGGRDHAPTVRQSRDFIAVGHPNRVA